MELENEILKLTCTLYKNLKTSRSDIQYTINCFQNFIANCYNPFLLKKLNTSLFKAVDQEVINAIESTFERFKDPFHKVESEEKRFNLYKHIGLYVEPEVCILKQEEITRVRGSNICLQSKVTSTVHLSIKHSLKQLLEMEGLFEATLSYMSHLKAEDKLITNFVQGSLWKKQLEHFKKDCIVLPLFVYFDDLETGNALGSHAGKNQVGTVYITIPCFPQNFASKLESIVMSDIFYSKDRKEFGNKIVFKELINELNSLRSYGININTNKKVFKVYFITSLIIGDNLGLNSILGFVESFSNTHFCRICNAGSETKILTEENESLLRTQENYEYHVLKGKSSETGIKESCIFNEIEGFNVIENSSVDVMHDIMEGVANYVIAEILLKFIDDNYFTIDLLNNALKTMDFAFESSNIPLDISLDYVKNNGKLKMSASELLCFARYLPFMIGEYIPEDNEIWLLYLRLREIIHIVTSPQITNSHLLQLKIFIRDHHRLYLKLFGHLKAKFHLLIHYIRMILQNGPVINSSSMRFESKHREIKAILNASSSNKNILKSVSIRHQLSLMYHKYSKYEQTYIKYGPEVKDDEVGIHFSKARERKTLSNVVINDITYKRGTIILAEICESGPRFGEITKIFEVDKTIFFKYTPFKKIGFSDHYYAFSVIADTDTKRIVDYESIPLKVPCLLANKNGNSYIATRFII